MTQTAPNQKRFADIKLILKDMLKVIKVVAMYPEGNPLPQSLRRSFSEKLVQIIEDYGEIRLIFAADKITYDSEVVFIDVSREESLAGLFFENGIMSLTFCNPLDLLEVYKLLDTIKAYQNKNAQNADLASLLWEANFVCIKFTTVEDVSLAQYDGDFRVQEFISTGSENLSEERRSAYDAIFREDTDPGNDSGGYVVELPDDVTDEEIRELKKLAQSGNQQSSGAPISGPMPDGRAIVDKLRAARKKNAAFFLVDPANESGGHGIGNDLIDSSTLKVAEAAEAMGFGDLVGHKPTTPDTALILNDEFKLTEEEEVEIRSLLVADAQFDMYESTTELLAEMLLQETELSAFFETVGICEKVTFDLVSAGRLVEAGHILSHLRRLEEELAESKPLWSERLRDARISAGSAARMKQFGESLNQHPEISTFDIRSYLEVFSWEALGAITDLLGDLQHRVHREFLCDFLSNRGKDNLAIIAKGVHDKRWFVVRNSVGILAKINDDKAIGYLAPAMKHDDKRVRLEVLNAIKERTDSRTLDILSKALLDKESDIRRTSLAAILHNRGKGCFEAVAHMIADPSFQTIEPDEQTEALRVYAILGGERAIAFLRKLATRINLLSDSGIALHRAAAINALAHSPSESAETALIKLRSHWIPDVRKQAREAVNLRRELKLRPQTAPVHSPTNAESSHVS